MLALLAPLGLPALARLAQRALIPLFLAQQVRQERLELTGRQVQLVLLVLLARASLQVAAQIKFSTRTVRR